MRPLLFYVACVCLPCQRRARVRRPDEMDFRRSAVEKLDLSQRRVAHAKARANVFRYQFDCRAVADRVGLGQIFHGFYQEPLAVDISRIGGSFPAFVTQLRGYRNRKNLSHEYILTDVWSV